MIDADVKNPASAEEKQGSAFAAQTKEEALSKKC